MQWEDHIKNVNQKILFKYSKIKAIASSLTPHAKKLLINALVMHVCMPMRYKVVRYHNNLTKAHQLGHKSHRILQLGTLGENE